MALGDFSGVATLEGAPTKMSGGHLSLLLQTHGKAVYGVLHSKRISLQTVEFAYDTWILLFCPAQQ
jgi:hypothetical protein